MWNFLQLAKTLQDIDRDQIQFIMQWDPKALYERVEHLKRYDKIIYCALNQNSPSH